MDIRFRFLNISNGNLNNITGFALCFDSLNEADVVFKTLIKSYDETHIYEKTMVKFSSCSNETYNLHFCIKGIESFHAHLMQIDKKFVFLLRDAIEKQGNIFIITAKSTKEDEFIINKGKYICVSRIYIDDTIIERKVHEATFDMNLLKELIA